MSKPFLVSLLLVSFIFHSLNAQIQKKIEEQLIASVSANNSEAILFLEKVVNINSGTLNLKGVKEVGSVFSSAFESIGNGT